MKDAMRLAQSLHQQSIEEIGLFYCFSRCSKARSEGFEKRDSRADFACQKCGFLHLVLTVNGSGARTC
jgi:hypothetical protein